MARSPFGEPKKIPEPKAVGEIVRGLLGDSKMRRGIALGRLVKGWADVVGERLAAQTRPIALDERGLTVGASSSAWAAQARFLETEIRARATELLGGADTGPVQVVVAPKSPR